MKSRPPRKPPSTKSPTSAKKPANKDVKLVIGSVLTLFGGLGLYFTAPPVMWFAAIVFVIGLALLWFYMSDGYGF